MIDIILGTKAEFLRLYPLMLYFEKKEQPYALIHSCQHELGDSLQRFGVNPTEFIDFPEYSGTKIAASPSNARKGIGLYRKLKRLLKQRDPRWAVYQGDTFTTGIAASAAKNARVHSAHVEAGLRSGSWREPFPEELIRRWADHRADLLFAPSFAALNNLYEDKVKGMRAASGSTSRDSVADVISLPNTRKPGDYCVATMHRYENVFSKDRCKKIIDILNLCQTPIVWPLHSVTKDRLESYGLLGSLKNCRIIEPLEYREFIEHAVASSKFVITDGGGLEEESIVLGKRSLLLRKKVERIEPVELGLSLLTELDTEKAKKQLRFIEDEPVCDAKENPYYLGRPASEIIGDRLIEG